MGGGGGGREGDSVLWGFEGAFGGHIERDLCKVVAFRAFGIVFLLARRL